MSMVRAKQDRVPNIKSRGSERARVQGVQEHVTVPQSESIKTDQQHKNLCYP